MRLFTERYREILYDTEGNSKEGFCDDDEIAYDVRQRIEKLMETYEEPHQVKISRYDDETVEVSALEIAICQMNDLYGYERIQKDRLPWYGNSHQIAVQPTPILFDLIELQYGSLSFSERESFVKDLNSLFNDYEINWVLADGKLIKVDAEQFDFDMKIKMLQELHQLKGEDSKFQSAYDELHSAIKNYEIGNYVDAINWAEKSYESMLKIILGSAKGNASALTQRYVEEKIHLPENVNVNGFKDSVLMSLSYIRNNCAAHGAGEANVVISKSLAHLAINMASSLNTYLIEEYKYSN